MTVYEDELFCTMYTNYMKEKWENRNEDGWVVLTETQE